MVRQAPSPVRCGRHDPFGKLRARQAQGKLLGAVWLFFNYTRRVKESRWKTGDGIGVRVARWYGLICSEILRRHSHISEARCGAPGGGESTTTPSGRTLRWVTGHRPQRYGWQRAWGMEKWKPLRASHFSTPPTATINQQRYSKGVSVACRTVMVFSSCRRYGPQRTALMVQSAWRSRSSAFVSNEAQPYAANIA